jgi:hypothetical protein
MEIDTDRDHVAIILKFFIDDVLVPGFDFFQPDIPIGAVDGHVLIEEELKASTRMCSKPILGVIESPRSLDGRVIPTAAA